MANSRMQTLKKAEPSCSSAEHVVFQKWPVTLEQGQQTK